MSIQPMFDALLLGVIEGLTEFLPVSSTAHLLLLGDVLGFEGPPGKVFEVVVQLGAILAVCVVYFNRLFGVVKGLPSELGAQKFAFNLFMGFLPAAIIGLALHKLIKEVLFHSPVAMCLALIVGGVIILVVDRFVPTPRYHRIEQMPGLLALRIGFFQCLAMQPGVSRSGATIIGALLMRVDRRTAAEFSFFLAIPTMLAATTLDLLKNWSLMTTDGISLIIAGFLAAFITAMIALRGAMALISHFGFAPFGWYRILFGSGMLFLLLRG